MDVDFRETPQAAKFRALAETVIWIADDLCYQLDNKKARKLPYCMLCSLNTGEVRNMAGCI